MKEISIVVLVMLLVGCSTILEKNCSMPVPKKPKIASYKHPDKNIDDMCYLKEDDILLSNYINDVDYWFKRCNYY